MHLIGRWERVRELGPAGYGPALVLDRKWRALRPYPGTGEWWRSRAGVWRPLARVLADERGALFGSRQQGGLWTGYSTPGGLAFQTTNLSSAYTYGSAGASCGMRTALLAGTSLAEVFERFKVL